MFIKKFYLLLIIIIITSCSSAPKKNITKTQFVPDIAGNKFVGVTDIEDYLDVNNYQNKFIVAAPDHKRFSEFNNFFQLGILTAKNQLKISNEVKFIDQENLNLLEANKNFLIGPLSNEIVINIDGLLLKDKALLLNDAVDNYSISLSQESQISTLETYLLNNSIERLGIIEDENNPTEQTKDFKKKWLNENRDAVTIAVDNDPSTRIENFLNVTDSKFRFQIIDEASFSDVEFIPRTRKDFSQVVVFTNDLSRLYEIASLVRFNYGLEYEIFSLTSNFDQKIDKNEISLHDITLIDHTYENRFTSDLPKSRSFCLGFDALLVSYAIANNVKGEIRGLLGIYKITNESLVSKSYIN
ncbi:MAG: hypothetical protein CMQ70_01640 [Gammaproteobacteria bacterium]|nr:hypothetical protein [Gammaproteobacteria bacterium]